jgi:hypothetical protein
VVVKVRNCGPARAERYDADLIGELRSSRAAHLVVAAAITSDHLAGVLLVTASSWLRLKRSRSIPA